MRLRLRLVFALAACLAPICAAAQGWMLTAPADQAPLILRAAPSADAQAIAEIAPGALVAAVSGPPPDPASVAVAVADPGAAWLRVGLGEQQGWLALASLIPAPYARLSPDDPTPAYGICGGYEPFWSLSWTPETITYAAPDIPAQTRPLELLRAQGRPFLRLQAGEDPARRWLFRFENAQCLDTPLDAPVWGRADLILTEEGESRWLTGCCRLAPQALNLP